MIYDGFKAAVAGGVPKEQAGILVDEQFGAAILHDAASTGYITACPAEKSGQDEFDFEYGDDFARHIETFNPTFCKVLVRYNPEGDKALNQRQAARLKRLSDYLHGSGRLYMVELLGGPRSPPRWKVRGRQEGLRLRPASRADGASAPRTSGRGRRGGRVEDRGAGPPRGLREGRRGCAAGRPQQRRLHHPGPRRGRQEGARVAGDGGRVPGFIGFAVGRTTFWDPLVDWRANRIAREAAVAEIARRYREWVNIFEMARLLPTQSVRLTRQARRRWENEEGRPTAVPHERASVRGDASDRADYALGRVSTKRLSDCSRSMELTRGESLVVGVSTPHGKRALLFCRHEPSPA